MTYTLSMPESCLARVNPARQQGAALMLSRVTENGADCAMEVTDFIELDALCGGESGLIRSPAVIEAIDKAMAHCQCIALLRTETCMDEESFDPGSDMTSRVIFRIAYHYLPSGPHACIACGSQGLLGKVWLRDNTVAPLEIRLC